MLARVLPRVRDIRRAGAAALDLAWCACGRYDAYYERGVKPWDVAAGGLIAERAGLALRSLEARDDEPAGSAGGAAGGGRRAAGVWSPDAAERGQAGTRLPDRRAAHRDHGETFYAAPPLEPIRLSSPFQRLGSRHNAKGPSR